MTKHLTSEEQLLVGIIFIGFLLYWAYADGILGEIWHSFRNKEKTNRGDGEGSSKYPKGVFIDLITITKAENADSQYNDCNIFVVGESPSPHLKYPKKFYLGGNHHKDGKTILDWGSSKNDTQSGSWKVCAFIEAVTGKKPNEIKLNEDGSIEEVQLADLLGRQVHILQYESNGKYSRETWFYFGSVDGGKEFLLDKWNRMSSPPKGYKHQ